jgi:flagellar FliL protein
MKKKKLLILAVPLLLAGLGAGAWFGGLVPGAKKKEPVKVAAPKPKVNKAVFFELPDIVVNLTGRNGRSSYMKIKINLELKSKADIKKVEAVMPRVIDNLQVYLRELQVEDVQGSEGLYRLREELLHRINIAAKPVRVNDVLFAEMLMQ